MKRKSEQGSQELQSEALEQEDTKPLEDTDA